MTARAEGDDGGFEPSYSQWISIRHYYGDPVRQLFLGAAALMLVASPLYMTSIATQLPFAVVGAIVAVAFAALTNPHSKFLIVADAVIAGVGVVIFGGWALLNYSDISSLAFALRIGLALIFLFAFYFAMKTVRAAVLGQIGQREPFNEFDSPTTDTDVEVPVSREYKSQLRAREEGRLEGWIQEED